VAIAARRPLDASNACCGGPWREEELVGAQEGVERERERVMLETAKAQRMLRRFEDLATGRYHITATADQLYAELDKARGCYCERTLDRC
jgi:hypothetical protein